MKWSVIGFTGAAGLVLLLGSAVPAQAESDALWSKFDVTVGAYRISTDDKIRLDASADLLGTEITLEKDLGLPDSKSLLYGRFDWAFADKHSLDLNYYSYNRDASRAITRQVEIGGVTFPVGAEVGAKFDTTSAEVAYNYWFVRQENFGFAGSLGLVYLKLDTSVSASVVIGPGGATTQQRVTASTDLPVPMLGVAIKGRPAKWLILRGSFRYLPSVSVGDIDGEAGTFAAGADFLVWGPMAVEIGYTGSIYKVDISDSSWNGSVDLSTEGWTAALRFHF